MSSKPKNTPSKLPKSKPRNSNALSAKSRVAGMAPMKSKNAPRGGNKNEQRELLEEVENEESFDYEFQNCRCETCADGFPYHIEGVVKGVRFVDPYHIVWVSRDDSECTLVYKSSKGDAYYPELVELMELKGWKLLNASTKEHVEKLLMLA